MRPVPSSFLLVLLLALCGLCAWQWTREARLRKIAVDQRMEVQQLIAQRDELENRAKAADAEILRLTTTLAEMRAQSVSKDSLDEQQQAAQKLRETMDKQNETLKQQGEAIARQNQSILQANENIKRLAAERDQVTRKLNEVTALYNKLAR